MENETEVREECCFTCHRGPMLVYLTQCAHCGCYFCDFCPPHCQCSVDETLRKMEGIPEPEPEPVVLDFSSSSDKEVISSVKKLLKMNGTSRKVLRSVTTREQALKLFSERERQIAGRIWTYVD